MARHAGLYCVDGHACRRDECTEQLQMCRHDRDYSALVCRDKSADIAEVLELRVRIAELEASQVPEGWQAVPKEPTEDMQIPSYLGPDGPKWPVRKEVYRAMLAAAPSPADSGEEKQ